MADLTVRHPDASLDTHLELLLGPLNSCGPIELELNSRKKNPHGLRATASRMIQRLLVHPLARPRPAVSWVSHLTLVYIDDEQELPAPHRASLDLIGQE